MPTDPLSEAELEEQLEEQVIDLPARAALSIVDPGIFGLRNPITLGRPPAESNPAGGENAPDVGDAQT
jgi:hypothetical protein